MDLSKIKEIIFGIPGKIKELFSGLSSIKIPINFSKFKIKGFNSSGFQDKFKTIFHEAIGQISRFLAFFYDNIQRIPFVQRVPEEKRKPFIVGLGGLCGLFFVLLIAILINAGKQTKTPTGAINIGFSIPQEELFIPAEPDFVPELLFEREPRRYWALEDLRPYWRKPEISEHWKEEIKSAVDKIMEGVP